MEQSKRGGPCILPLRIRIYTLMLWLRIAPDAVPTWPTPAGRKTITLELPNEHVAFLDTQARHRGCSRAAFIRWLIVSELERQAAPTAAA